LFHGTLRQNLLVGNPTASDEWMLRVAEAVGVADIARAHPRGYDMVINERGEGLSGGQRQAVAIARALIVKPSALLFDEPTSAMDQGSEQRALNAILELAAGKTIVMVTHKMSIVGFAQRLIVLDAGLILADGPRQVVIDALNAGKVQAPQASGSQAGPMQAASAQAASSQQSVPQQATPPQQVTPQQQATQQQATQQQATQQQVAPQPVTQPFAIAARQSAPILP
jgi:ABC-type protease/lipase transport system fused ATPase/permease subunit